MKGGRLRIINESSYPTEEVEPLVQFGLDEIDVKGYRIVVVVQDTRMTKRREHERRDYSGTAWSLHGGIPVTMCDKYLKSPRDWFLLFVRIGPGACFPIEPYTRNGVTHDYESWQEAMVGITAHEGMHAQHSHDRSYRTRSGNRAPATFTDAATGRKVTFRRGGKVRVGGERIEPKCEAFEAYMVRRFRAKVAPSVRVSL